MSIKSKKPSYGELFAEDVVTSFLEKYSRATDILSISIGWDRGSMQTALQNAVRFDQWRWEMLKALIKGIQRDEGISEILTDKGLSREEKRNYLTYVKKIMKERVWDDDKNPIWR